MWVHTWHGERTIIYGGAKARSSSIWTTTCIPPLSRHGTEDYFCGSYNFDPSPSHNKGYVPYTTPYAGFQVIRPYDDYHTQMRFGLYRWHITDPIRFEKNIKVEIQALGWGSNDRYLPLQDDMASVAFWYQTLPTASFPNLPDANYLEII